MIAKTLVPAALALFCSVISSQAQTVETVPGTVTDAQPPAQAQTVPYDTQLLRLAEVLGSVQYLRHLCGAGSATEWQTKMQELIEIEAKNEPARKAALTASYNRGFRSFASTYISCTAAAVASAEQYRIEGATLAAEIATRYGN